MDKNLTKKNILTILVFSVVCIGILNIIYIFTKDIIVEANANFEKESISTILDINSYDNIATSAFQADNNANISKILLVKKNNETIAVIINATTNGWGGEMNMIVVISRNLEILGAKVLTHKETPGLGDKITSEKSNWIDAFIGKSLENTPKDKWKVKKFSGEFDALVGATVSPSAVIGLLRELLIFVQMNKQKLFAE